MKFHHFKLDDWDEFRRKFLKTNRLSFYTGGAFSAVYYTGHPNSRFVYKITDELTTNSRSWDGYIVYLNSIVLKHQNNPHVPKIYGVNTYEYLDEYGKLCHRAIIKMERLLGYNRLNYDLRGAILRKQYGIDSRRDYYGDDAWLNKAHDSLNNCSSKVIERIFEHGIKSPNLLKIFMLTNERIREYKNIHSDIHDGNVMWRKRGQKYELVIVDPIA